MPGAGSPYGGDVESPFSLDGFTAPAGPSLKSCGGCVEVRAGRRPAETANAGPRVSNAL